MSSGNIEDRIMQLEQKVRQLESISRPGMNAQPWWERVAGAFIRVCSSPAPKVRSDLWRLHVGQDKHRFSKDVAPPSERGKMCSNSKITTVNASGVRQYAQ